MPRKKISTTIYLDPAQYEQLKVLNERTRVPMAELIRQAIDAYLDDQRDKLPGQPSLFDR